MSAGDHATNIQDTPAAANATNRQTNEAAIGDYHEHIRTGHNRRRRLKHRSIQTPRELEKRQANYV
jgi:hypothetical protein